MTTSDVVKRRSYNASIVADLHSQSLVGRILAGRGVLSKDDLRLSLDRLLLPGSMQDFDTATDLLSDAVISGKKILIVGDYDCLLYTSPSPRDS